MALFVHDEETKTLRPATAAEQADWDAQYTLQEDELDDDEPISLHDVAKAWCRDREDGNNNDDWRHMQFESALDDLWIIRWGEYEVTGDRKSILDACGALRDTPIAEPVLINPDGEIVDWNTEYNKEGEL